MILKLNGMVPMATKLFLMGLISGEPFTRKRKTMEEKFIRATLTLFDKSC